MGAPCVLASRRPSLASRRAIITLGARNCADLLHVVRHLALEPLVHVGADDADRVDAERGTDRELRELVAHAQLGQLLGVPANEEEPAEVTAVRLEEDGLEALDLAFLLQAGVPPDRLVEELDGLALSPAYGVAEADEQAGICHVPHLLLGRAEHDRARGATRRG